MQYDFADNVCHNVIIVACSVSIDENVVLFGGIQEIDGIGLSKFSFHSFSFVFLFFFNISE